MSADSKSVYRVTLRVERMQNVLVDVIASHYVQLLEPWNVVFGRDLFEKRSCL